jgi:hypothetical protein
VATAGKSDATAPQGSAGEEQMLIRHCAYSPLASERDSVPHTLTA